MATLPYLGTSLRLRFVTKGRKQVAMTGYGIQCGRVPRKILVVALTWVLQGDNFATAEKIGIASQEIG